MINTALERISLLIGEQSVIKIQNSCVLVVGVGGVGSYVVEALVRTGVGTIIMIDNDIIQPSNLNRQIHATTRTINEVKTEAMKERILSINPDCNVIAIQSFFDKSKTDVFEHKIDYVVDAIDTVTSKLDLIEICQSKNLPIISSLGMANRFDVSKLKITTLEKTKDDPLAKAVRYQARKRGINCKVKVAFSEELPFKQNQVVNEDALTRKQQIPPASTIFVPAAAGLMIASHVILELIKE